MHLPCLADWLMVDPVSCPGGGGHAAGESVRDLCRRRNSGIPRHQSVRVSHDALRRGPQDPAGFLAPQGMEATEGRRAAARMKSPKAAAILIAERSQKVAGGWSAAKTFEIETPGQSHPGGMPQSSLQTRQATPSHSRIPSGCGPQK